MSCFRCADDKDIFDSGFPRKFKCIESSEFETITDEQIDQVIEELKELKKNTKNRFLSASWGSFDMTVLKEIYESLYRNENYRWWLMK